jgi:hypothetical protein
MNTLSPTIRWLGGGIFLAVAIVIVTSFLPPFSLGHNDLRPYWGASYLLRHGQPFTDPQQMNQIQWLLTDAPAPTGAMMTWNPPWLLVVLIPLTFFDFQHAVWLWLITSLILFGLVITWTSHAYLPEKIPTRASQVLLFALLLFPPFWNTLALGQISTLVLLGLAGYLRFYEQKPLLAGIFLALTIIKPHLVLLVLPLIFLHSLWRRQWPLLAGFAGFILITTLLTFALRPTFLAEYIALMSQRQSLLLALQTPTLANLIFHLSGYRLSAFIGLLALPFMIGYWWYIGRHTPSKWLHTATIFILLSVTLMPYGFAFDFVVLFIPIIAVIMWLLQANPLSKPMQIGLIVAYIALNILFFHQRSTPIGQFTLGWYPLAIGLLFAWATWSKQSMKGE